MVKGVESKEKSFNRHLIIKPDGTKIEKVDPIQKKEEVGTVVNKIEEIDSKIKSLTQEKGKITSEYYVDLLEHDLETIENVESILMNLKTEKAAELVEEYDFLGLISDVTSEIKGELKKVKN